MIDHHDLDAVVAVTRELQVALTCLDDIINDHEPCEQFSDADPRCTVSWLPLDDNGECTHRIAYRLLKDHGLREKGPE